MMTDIQQFCTFQLADHFFGVEVARVQEVLRYQDMTRVPLADDAISGLINLRGQIVTAIDLRKFMGIEPLPEGERSMNVVLRSGDEVISLLVDEIGDVLEVADQYFEAPPDTMSSIGRELCRGVYKLEDRLLLIMDVEKVVNSRLVTA